MGLVGSEGKIIDASFVDVPRQRNSREENEIIKAGAVPIEFGKNDHKLSQKEMDARWTKQKERAKRGKVRPNGTFLLEKSPLIPLFQRGTWSSR